MAHSHIVSRALSSGTIAALLSAATLAVLGRQHGKGAAQPINATSHWLHGNSAASQRRPDLRHTVVGFATHHASAVFWALLFEALRGPRRAGASRSRSTVRAAAATAAIASAVDYGLMPRRWTPGWELVLPASAVAAALLALGAGLAIGGSIDDARS